MTRNNQPRIEMVGQGRRDTFDQPFARRPSRLVDDDLTPSFQLLDLGEKKGKVKERQSSMEVEAGKIIRRRSSGAEKRPPRYYEFYRFQKSGDNWTVADKIQMKAPQEELEKRVSKGRSRMTILDKMTAMNDLRRKQIYRLLDQKNAADRDQATEWVPVLIETIKQRANSVLAFDIIIAQSGKPGGASSHERRISFSGERSDLREPITPKSKGKGKDNDTHRDSKGKWNPAAYDHDPFGSGRLFELDGRPVHACGPAFEVDRYNRPSVPLEAPIAGPFPRLQPMRPPPIGWNDPFRPGEMPPALPYHQPYHQPHNQPYNQPLLDIVPDHHHEPHADQAGNGFIDLDQLLEHPQGGGGSGGSHPHGDTARLENFDRPERRESRSIRRDQQLSLDRRPSRSMGRNRQRSLDRRPSGSRKSQSNRIYPGQGAQRRREHSGRDRYWASSVEDEDEAGSVFFDVDDPSSISSFDEDHDRFIEKRGSLKRTPSRRRGDPPYREHQRRRASYTPGRREVVMEPARTPRRPTAQRRQTIAATEPRQIAYPARYGRDRDLRDEPREPVFPHRSPSPASPRRPDNRGPPPPPAPPPPPSLYHPDDFGGRDRKAEDYIDSVEREHDNVLREEVVRRSERELEEMDRKREERSLYGEHRDHY